MPGVEASDDAHRSDIKLEQYGLVLAGEHEGYYIFVHHDVQHTLGYYIYFVDDIEKPADGGDYWAKDMAEVERIFRAYEWRIEWSK